MSRVVVERRIDMPRPIVWEALVDPVLVEGWLHPSHRIVDDAEVRELEEPEALEVVSEQLGHLVVALGIAPGGTRGSSTDLSIELVPCDAVAVDAAAIAAWEVRLDQLEDLLHGHPVEWDRWHEDRGADYAAHLQRAEQRVR
jgi:uncharacterized protein YndB with AHSA1/START domain